MVERTEIFEPSVNDPFAQYNNDWLHHFRALSASLRGSTSASDCETYVTNVRYRSGSPFSPTRLALRSGICSERTKRGWRGLVSSMQAVSCRPPINSAASADCRTTTTSSHRREVRLIFRACCSLWKDVLLSRTTIHCYSPARFSHLPL